MFLYDTLLQIGLYSLYEFPEMEFPCQKMWKFKILDMYERLIFKIQTLCKKKFLKWESRKYNQLYKSVLKAVYRVTLHQQHQLNGSIQEAFRKHPWWARPISSTERKTHVPRAAVDTVTQQNSYQISKSARNSSWRQMCQKCYTITFNFNKFQCHPNKNYKISHSF